MPVTFELWYLFPASILIATIALASGIGGAVFFSLLFMILLELEPNPLVLFTEAGLPHGIIESIGFGETAFEDFLDVPKPHLLGRGQKAEANPAFLRAGMRSS